MSISLATLIGNISARVHFYSALAQEQTAHHCIMTFRGNYVSSIFEVLLSRWMCSFHGSRNSTYRVIKSGEFLTRFVAEPVTHDSIDLTIVLYML